MIIFLSLVQHLIPGKWYRLAAWTSERCLLNGEREGRSVRKILSQSCQWGLGWKLKSCISNKLPDNAQYYWPSDYILSSCTLIDKNRPFNPLILTLNSELLSLKQIAILKPLMSFKTKKVAEYMMKQVELMTNDCKELKYQAITRQEN